MDGKRRAALATTLALTLLVLGTAVSQASASTPKQTLRGTVHVVMNMLKNGGMAVPDVTIQADNGKTYRVANGGSNTQLQDLAERRVTATGRVQGAAVTLDQFHTTDPNTPRHLGAQRLAIIKLEIGRYPIKDIHGSARSVLLDGKNSVAAMWKSQSNGKLTLTGDEFSDTLPADLSRTCDYYMNWASYLVQKHPGYDFYAIIVNVGCGQLAGQATLGGGISWYYVGMFPEVAWHEMGHNLGFHHASSLACYDQDQTPVAIANNCTQIEYGDWWDTMGQTAAGRCSYNQYDRVVAGWEDSSSWQEVDGSADVELRARNVDQNGLPHAIVIPGAPAQWGGYYFLEWRTNDVSTCKDRRDRGVQVRAVANPATGLHTFILDTSPLTWGPGKYHPAFYLENGKTFHDPMSGVTVTVVSQDVKTGVTKLHISR